MITHLAGSYKTMGINDYVEVTDYQGEGYRPLIDYESWRVAILRYIPSLEPDCITDLECHRETDEVFVLLEGKCILFIGIPDQAGSYQIQAVDMVPLKLYNIKKGVYHSHTLSKDASVLIVENQNTSDMNSHKIKLTENQQEQITSYKGIFSS